MQALSLFLRNNRQLLFFSVLITLFLICVFVIPTVAFGQGPQNVGTINTQPTGAAGNDCTWGWCWVTNNIKALIYGMVIAIGLGIAGIGGLLLDTSINYTVLQMGVFLNPTGGLGTGVQQLWAVIRDILNILFIFGLIYIGIKTILNAEDSGTRRMLGLLIVAALLINFSLYITQVVVDFSNIAAFQIHNQITNIGSSGAGQVGEVTFQSGSIAGSLMDLTHITSFFGGDQTSLGELGFTQVIFYSIFMLIFLIIAGIVFGMAAVLLIGRFIALIIYMILSPIMFMGWIFPAFSGYQKKWWGGFFKQAFFAPAFLFMLYLSFVVLQRLQTLILGDNPVFTSFLAGGKQSVDTFTIILFFCMMIGFLYASIKVASSMGAAGASGSLKALDWMGKAARGSAQGFAYRNTVGRGLNWGVEKIDAANRAEGKGNRWARTGNMLIRGVTGGEAGRQGLEKASNLGMGGRGLSQVKKDESARVQRTARGRQIHDIEHVLGGNDTAAKEKVLRDASSAQLLEMMHHGGEKDIVKNAGMLSESQAKAILDDKEINDKVKADFSVARGTQTENRLKENNKKEVIDPATGLPQKDASGNIVMRNGTTEEIIGKADTSELKAMGSELAKQHAGYLTAKQIEDWKDLTPTEKNELKATRKSQLEAEFAGGTGATNLFDRIKSDEERSKLPDSILKISASLANPKTGNPLLNTNVLAKIVDNNGISDTDRSTIKANIMSQFPSTATQKNNPQYKKYKEFFEKNNAGQRY